MQQFKIKWVLKTINLFWAVKPGVKDKLIFLLFWNILETIFQNICIFNICFIINNVLIKITKTTIIWKYSLVFFSGILNAELVKIFPWLQLGLGFFLFHQCDHYLCYSLQRQEKCQLSAIQNVLLAPDTFHELRVNVSYHQRQVDFLHAVLSQSEMNHRSLTLHRLFFRLSIV